MSNLHVDGQFLLDRIDQLDWSVDAEEFFRDWCGHVEPAIARLRAAIEEHNQTAERDEELLFWNGSSYERRPRPSLLAAQAHGGSL